MYLNVNNALTQETLGGLKIVSSSVNVVNSSSPSADNNLGLILGLSIPIGILGTFSFNYL